MRVLHVPYGFFPDPPGGTEIYVDALARHQRALGCEVAIAAPGKHSDRYEHAGIPVWRFAVSPSLGLRDIYGEGDRAAAEAFGAILDSWHPDIVHLHAMTSAVSVRLASQVSNRGIPLVFNYHTPTVSCLRGTLLRWGTEICDGRLHQQPCAACVLQNNGVPRAAASLLAHLPESAGHAVENTGRSGGVWTALRMPELAALRIEMFRRMMHRADRVIALCNWTRSLLESNGVPAAKISLCRQGIDWQPAAESAARPAPVAPLRLAFLGRFEATKGVHIIVEALRKAPQLSIELDLYGIRQPGSGDSYVDQVRNLIGNDPRLRLLPPLPSADVISALRNYDALLVPSQSLETGPLVVLEAFAAGTPVIGSHLGGIAELVTHNVDGILVGAYSSAKAWTTVFQSLSANSNTLPSLRTGIKPPRHAKQVALDLMPLYEELMRARMNTGRTA